MTKYLTPNEQIKNKSVLIGLWSLIGLALWQALKPVVFPNPLEVIQAVPNLISEGLFEELISSMIVNLEAICLSTLIGLPLAYLSRVPAVSPIAEFVGKLRFLGSAVFFLPLLFIFSGGHWVKVWLIVLGQLFYLTTTMVGVVASIPDYRFDDARTLNMSEWKSVWYVNIRGTVAEAIETVRQNAAIGWAMLMFVEGLVRSEGGIGVMILLQEKHVEWASLWALVGVVLTVGIVQDYIIGQVKKVTCPYAI